MGGSLRHAKQMFVNFKVVKVITNNQINSGFDMKLSGLTSACPQYYN